VHARARAVGEQRDGPGQPPAEVRDEDDALAEAPPYVPDILLEPVDELGGDQGPVLPESPDREVADLVEFAGQGLPDRRFGGRLQSVPIREVFVRANR